MIRRLAATAAFMFAVSCLAAQAVDLSAADAYVRPGFSLEWVFSTPLPGDALWTVVPGAAGNRPLVMRELDLPGSPRRRLFTLERMLPQRYCVMIPFVAGEELLASRTGVGLYLAQIGQNWQIYLNGSLIRDETYTAADGRMRVDRSVRGALIEVDTRYLRKGRNLLSIMVAGNPMDEHTGLFTGGPYLVDAYGNLESLRSESLKLILIGIYFFFALYHAILYAFRPKAKTYLFYGLATGLLSVFLFFRTFIAYELILDTRIVKAVETAALFLLIPAFMAFIDAVVGRRVSPFAKIYGAVFAVAAVLRLFILDEAILRLWQYTVVLPVAWVLVTDIALPLSRSTRQAGLWQALSKTVAGKLLLGIVVAGTAVLLDVVGTNAGLSAAYSDYAYLLLVFGTAATLAGQFVRAFNENETLGADLASRVQVRSTELEATLADQGALSVVLAETSGRLQASVDATARDMRVATRVQQGFFPSAAPRNAIWDTAFTFIPSSGISGDFYDFYRHGERLDGLVVGDVSGHGIASGLVTVLARSIFHRNFYELKNRSLGAVLEAINEELIPELSAVENFITAALLRIDEEGRLEYASAAHTEILYRGADRPHAMPLKPKGSSDYKGPPLGREGFDSPYTSIRFGLRPGDSILIYTDGFDEARNVDGEPFGVDGMLGALTSAPVGDASQMLDFIVREWRFHVSGTKVADDATAVLLKRQ